MVRMKYLIKKGDYIMKNLLFILIFILLFSSCMSEQTEQQYESNIESDEQLNYWTGLEPVINGFHGELFGDTNITADGYYTGYEKLSSFGYMIYCNDNGAIIWRDDEKNAIYRLDSRNRKEKICPHKDCRNDIESACEHVPIYELIYSNGVLYFTVNEATGVFVYRYDIEKHEIEKLMKIQGVSSSALALNGRYLYALTYNWDPTEMYIAEYYFKQKYEFTITRIDLFTENATVIYSDLTSPDDFDKIGELKDWRFVDNWIITPKINEEKIWDKEVFPARWKILRIGSSINITTFDMNNFETLLEMEEEKIMLGFGGDLQLYNGEIYFTTDESGLSRIDIETDKREILNSSIMNFDIDEDFLYYMINNDGIYRIKLDYTRELNFLEAVAVYPYTPEEGYYLDNWQVHGGYLYADWRPKFEIWQTGVELSKVGRYKIKIHAQEEPHFLYK